MATQKDHNGKTRDGGNMKKAKNRGTNPINKPSEDPYKARTASVEKAKKTQNADPTGASQTRKKMKKMPRY